MVSWKSLIPTLMVLAYVRAEDGEEEEPELDYFTQSTSVIIILSAMIAFSILFENFREYIEENTKENLKPVLNSLFGELTLLGFIGLTLFLFDQLEAVKTLSESIFGEEGAIGEMCESVHMALFLVMVLFLATVLLLVHFGNSISAKWNLWEENTIAEHRLATNYRAIANIDGCTNQCFAIEPLEFQEISYAAIRRGFIADVNTDSNKETDLDPHFDFASYLEPLLGHVLAEFVEIPSTTWLMFEAFLIVAWQLTLILPPFILAVLYLLLGYSLPLLIRYTHGKLRSIKADVMLVGGDLHYYHNLLDHQQELKQRGQTERSVLLASAEELGDSGAIQSSLPRTDPSHLANVVLPRRFDPRSLHDHYGHTGHTSDRHHLRFWYGEKQKRGFMMGILRKTVLVNSVYLAVLLLMFLPTVFADEERSTLVKVVLVVVTLLPSFCLLWLLPDAVQDFVLVTSIMNMKNKRVLENAIRRMKTRQCFLTLKVIYMMTSGVKRKHGHEKKKFDEDNLPASEIRKRKVWKTIFDMMDVDNSGSVSQHELTSHLQRMAPGSMKEEDILEVMKELDEDDSGEIDFTEFLEYAAYVTDEADQSTEEIVEGMFNLVLLDTTFASTPEDEPTINIRQLQHALAKLGQNLSADDVYNVIKDIDENGDGQLNAEEFGTLLRLLDVVDSEE